MTAYLALLRGINVSRHQRIAMADLRALLTGLGHTDVATHLQSGNAVFRSKKKDPDALAAAIESAITAELGLTVRVLVRDDADLRRVVEDNPLVDVATDPSKLLVTFLSAPTGPAELDAVDPSTYAPEVMAVGEREVYVWYPDGVRKAKLNPPFFEKRYPKDARVAATARNWNTLTKLLTMMT
ncbi:DUF1697 domain-containing protein [Cryptosporangium aurantiacum]|uniref:Uncharacterized conserved protein, DUF1697 family n=1 Tax=Cryptosporangium aurantiacum TaxID=134849 RepID=A0A1M7QF59_9ACTN|nr:DUF1697 domain-containing protein [Cryptosporangium aurantiacum]SHN29636.1 Uncharacterized conserved protein, DUF1697 family [Cryptosporangium aurantiacum]